MEKKPIQLICVGQVIDLYRRLPSRDWHDLWKCTPIAFSTNQASLQGLSCPISTFNSTLNGKDQVPQMLPEESTPLTRNKTVDELYSQYNYQCIRSLQRVPDFNPNRQSFQHTAWILQIPLPHRCELIVPLTGRFLLDLRASRPIYLQWRRFL